MTKKGSYGVQGECRGEILENKIDIRKLLDKSIIIYLITGCLFLVFALLMDILKDRTAKFCFLLWGFFMRGKPLCIKHSACQTLSTWENTFLNVELTLGTILAASVIFFYSVQDNKKEGIPHRAIMSYTFGSFSVPLLFFVVMLLIPFNYTVSFLGLKQITWVALIFTYITQLMIMIIILQTTSYKFSLYAICNAEIRQYQKLCVIRTKQATTFEGRVQNENSAKVTQTSSFIWTFMLSYLEQVIVSEELVPDKMEMAKWLLRVPFYEKEIRYLDVVSDQFQIRRNPAKLRCGNLEMSVTRLQDNNLKAIYEFYFRNLITVLRHINQPQNKEERSKVYLILYEFLEELNVLYQNARDKMDKYDVNECYVNYTMTISGIMNAVMDSNADDSEYFCNYVFNHMVSEDAWYFQVSLYVLFQEYLYRTNDKAIKLNDLEGIDRIERWKWGKAAEESVTRLVMFWKIWLESTTLSDNISCQFFLRALSTLRGDSCQSEPIEYFNCVIKGLKDKRGSIL